MIFCGFSNFQAGHLSFPSSAWLLLQAPRPVLLRLLPCMAPSSTQSFEPPTWGINSSSCPGLPCSISSALLDAPSSSSSSSLPTSYTPPPAPIAVDHSPEFDRLPSFKNQASLTLNDERSV